jgi:hypothetical protein
LVKPHPSTPLTPSPGGEGYNEALPWERAIMRWLDFEVEVGGGGDDYGFIVGVNDKT